MSREILFRAKDINNNWVYGSYFKHIERQTYPVGDIEHLIIRDSFADWNMPKEIECVRINPDTVGQYIGLEDKKETKIFEGDIIKFFYNNKKFYRAIKYSMGEYGVLIERKCIMKANFLTMADLIGCVGGDFEVVGNIYENK